MRLFIFTFLLSFTSASYAGDTPIYPFTLGGWDFTLSSVGTPGGGPVVAVLEAKHKAKDISGEVSLDYRWYALADRQFDKGEKAARPFFETLVAFAASEWSKRINGDAILKAMKEAPPTADYRQSYDFLVNGQK